MFLTDHMVDQSRNRQCGLSSFFHPSTMGWSSLKYSDGPLVLQVVLSHVCFIIRRKLPVFGFHHTHLPISLPDKKSSSVSEATTSCNVHSSQIANYSVASVRFVYSESSRPQMQYEIEVLSLTLKSSLPHEQVSIGFVLVLFAS